MEPLRMKLEFLIGRYDLYSGNYEVGLKNIQTSIALAEKLHDWQYELENHLQLIFHAIQIDDLKMYYQNLLVCEQLVKEHEYSEADNCTVHAPAGAVLHEELSIRPGGVGAPCRSSADGGPVQDQL